MAANFYTIVSRF